MVTADPEGHGGLRRAQTRPAHDAGLGWPAPLATRPVSATVRLLGSKSLTNRALVLAAQAVEPSTIRGPLRSRDTELMATGLRALGCRIDDVGTDWRVEPAPLAGPAAVDCGLAGTVMRFLPPLAATASGEVTFDGDPAARRRPMRTVLDALRSLGADLDGAGLPFRLRGTGTLRGGEVRLDASGSSQFVSGLLLAGASYMNGVTVQHVGPPVPSLPHIEMSVAALTSVGVRVAVGDEHRWRVEPGLVSPWTALIEPDLSNATPFLAAAAVTGGSVTVPDWPAATTQAGDAIRGILQAMGVDVRRHDGALVVTGPADGLHGIDLDLRAVGELTPTIAAMALFADGPSHLRGIGHLRGHETDRLDALAADIAALGGRAEQDAESLRITPRALHGGPWSSYADHRMATAGAIVGLRVPGVLIDDIGTTAKTLPGFPRMWSAMLEGLRFGEDPQRLPGEDLASQGPSERVEVHR